MAMNRVELGEGSFLRGSVDNGQQLQLQLQLQDTPHFQSYENHETRNDEPQQMQIHPANLPDERMIVPSRPTSSGQLTATFIPYVYANRAPRLRWTPDLHSCFVQAVDSLGGEDRATPKKISQIMNVEGVTVNHIKSHLQLYRRMKHDERIQAARTKQNVREQSPAESVDSSATVVATLPWKDEEKTKPYLIFSELFPGLMNNTRENNDYQMTEANTRGAIDPTRAPSLNSSSTKASYSQRFRQREVGSSSNVNDVCLELTIGLRKTWDYTRDRRFDCPNVTGQKLVAKFF